MNLKLKMLKMALVGLVLSVSSFAHAGLISVSWSGTITSAGNASNVISIGDIITGHYEFETTPSQSGNNYDTNHNSYFSINGLNGYTSDNNIWSSSSGQFDTRGWGGTYFGDLIGGVEVSQIFVPFRYFTTGFDWQDALNTVQNASFLEGGSTGRLDGPAVAFNVDSFSINAAEVPEPSTLAIFALGILGLASRRFKKQ